MAINNHLMSYFNVIGSRIVPGNGRNCVWNNQRTANAPPKTQMTLKLHHFLGRVHRNTIWYAKYVNRKQDEITLKKTELTKVGLALLVIHIP